MTDASASANLAGAVLSTRRPMCGPRDLPGACRGQPILAAQHPSLGGELAGQCPQGPERRLKSPPVLWAAPWPIISRDAAAVRRHVLATRRRTVGPAPDAIGATHRVAATGFKVRANIRTPGPRGHARGHAGPRTTIARRHPEG